MKKRVNLFCFLVLALLLADFVIDFWLVGGEFMRGWNEAQDATELTSSGNINERWWYVLPTSVVIIYFGIHALVSFIRFIVNVNRNQVFIRDNVRYLRWVSLGMLVVSALNVLNQLFMHKNTLEVLSDSILTFVFCFFALIIAEAFALGIRLKEEQELTI